MTRARRHSRIVVAAALAIMAAVLAPSAAGAGTTPRAENGGLEKIEHIVMIMQENRTFDHYFGMFPGADGFPLDENGDVDICIPNPYEPGTCVPAHSRSRRPPGRAVHTATARTLLPSTTGRWMASSQAFADAIEAVPEERRSLARRRGASAPPTNRSTSWATSSRRTSPTTGATRASSCSRTTCSPRRTRGACRPTSTGSRGGRRLCKNRNPMSLRRTPVTTPTRRRAGSSLGIASSWTSTPTTRSPSSTTRSTRGPTSRTCCTRTT